MRWIPILVAACIIFKNVLSRSAFLQVFAEIIKFETHSHGLFNLSKKDSTNRHTLKTKFIFYSSLLFSKRKFSDKKSVFEKLCHKTVCL